MGEEPCDWGPSDNIKWLESYEKIEPKRKKTIKLNKLNNPKLKLVVDWEPDEEPREILDLVNILLKNLSKIRFNRIIALKVYKKNFNRILEEQKNRFNEIRDIVFRDKIWKDVKSVRMTVVKPGKVKFRANVKIKRLQKKNKDIIVINFKGKIKMEQYSKFLDKVTKTLDINP